jgi:hypothetical protein
MSPADPNRPNKVKPSLYTVRVRSMSGTVITLGVSTEEHANRLYEDYLTLDTTRELDLSGPQNRIIKSWS